MAQNTPFQLTIKPDQDAIQSSPQTNMPPMNPSGSSGPCPTNSAQQQNYQKFTLDWDDLDEKDEDESDKTNAERKRMFSKEIYLLISILNFFKCPSI